jgi:hyperosmotically inducible protein
MNNTIRSFQALVGATCIAFAVGVSAQTASSDTAASSHQGETASQKISDGVITTKVKAALLDAKEVTGSQHIHVRTHNGVVHLSGTVPSEQAKEAATSAAKTVDGVRSVSNKIKVAS